MCVMTNADFVIRGKKNIAKAAKALRALDLWGVRNIISQTYSKDDGEFLVNLFEGYGFECGECEEEEFSIFGMYEDRIDGAFEKILKAICEAVESGCYLEFSDYGEFFRYVFLHDHVERWTVPTILYAKKEVI